MTTTTTETIEYLQTEQIPPKGMTVEVTGNGVEATALPALSLRKRVQGSGEMGSSAWMGRNYVCRDMGVISPCRSFGGRPLTMVGRPREGAWRTGPQNPYATTPRGGTPGKFGFLGMMGADDGRAPPRRDATNLI